MFQNKERGHGCAKDLQIDDFFHLLHLPIRDAANELEISESRLKVVCRQNGIKRWPSRRIQSLQRFEVDMSIEYPRELRHFQQEIKALKEKIIYDSSYPMSPELLKYYKKLTQGQGHDQ